MSAESKPEDPVATKEAVEEVIAESNGKQPEIESDNEDAEPPSHAPPTSSAGGDPVAAKKKKSKKKRIKAALSGGTGESEAGPSREKLDSAVHGMSHSEIGELLKLNPALADQIGITADTSPSQAAEAMKKLNLEDIMTGLAASGKNVKDMGSYKFWGTQPVPKFGDTGEIKEGPFKIIDLERVPKEPGPLVDGFEWVTMDLTNDAELQEVFELLYGHFVEDDEGMFRFNYSKPFLKWALMSPGWHKDWHVGVRATASRKLVAFISAVPCHLRVRQATMVCSEVNFLCIHKKLRSKRLAPVLIKEITRISYRRGVWQGLYTGGVVLPKPVSTTRYFHRSIDWQKLNDVGFSPLPPNSKPSHQVRKYHLPDHTALKGLRPMQVKDIDAVLDLLKRYLTKYDMAPIFTREEIKHWMITKPEDQVVWSYVVEDTTTKKITDFFSFYNLESSVINHAKHKNVRAAYLYYYATEVALVPNATKEALKTRLNELISDALILAKKNKFDVFNALSLMDNGLFLTEQKFGPGDGQLHYYLYNYLANPIAGGVDAKNKLDENCSGVGVVML